MESFAADAAMVRSPTARARSSGFGGADMANGRAGWTTCSDRSSRASQESVAGVSCVCATDSQPHSSTLYDSTSTHRDDDECSAVRAV